MNFISSRLHYIEIKHDRKENAKKAYYTVIRYLQGLGLTYAGTNTFFEEN
jgi:hypothetical protein